MGLARGTAGVAAMVVAVLLMVVADMMKLGWVGGMMCKVVEMW